MLSIPVIRAKDEEEIEAALAEAKALKETAEETAEETEEEKVIKPEEENK